MKNKIINAVLWLAFLLALGASVSHLAFTFGTVESDPLYGWISAVAVDAGLAALTYSVQQRKRAKRPTLSLWLGVAGFAVISALANLYHALSVESGGAATVTSLANADWLAFSKALILSAVLPAMVIFLGEIVSADDAEAAKTESLAAERESARAERMERKALLEAERVVEEAKQATLRSKTESLAAERESLASETITDRANDAPLVSETSQMQSASGIASAFGCEACGRSFGSLNALNAHKRSHANGRAKEALENMVKTL